MEKATKLKSLKNRLRKIYQNNHSQALGKELLKYYEGHVDYHNPEDFHIRRDLLFRVMVYLPDSNSSAFRKFFKPPFKSHK